jgi:HAD superfamily hydrolase (TIGR01509 family)
LIIFDCNGVLVDSEPVAAAVAAQQFTHAGVPLTPESVMHHFLGRRPADMVAAVEAHIQRKLPAAFGADLAAATLKRFQSELRAMPHAAHALTWLREPKCVASSSGIDRIRASLDITGLARFFEGNLFSGSDVPRGKPAPDLFQLAARRMRVRAAECIVVEDSPAGVAAAASAGMMPIGFVGGGHAAPNLGSELQAAGARTVIADMRQLRGAIVDLRGW